MGKLLLIHQDAEFCNAINARMERLYYLDGRDNPDHKHHPPTPGWRRNTVLPTSRNQDIPA